MLPIAQQCFSVIATIFLAAPIVHAQQKAPTLGAVTNFSQGIQPQTLGFVRSLGVQHLRDGMNWARVEKKPGFYEFSGPRRAYKDLLDEDKNKLTLVINWGNPLYDNGHTPQSKTALNALEAYTKEVIGRFPVIETLEVGNEFNGRNFVRGPLEKMAPLERSQAYLKILKATSQGARAGREDIRILGGATHSLPGSWLWNIMDSGGAKWMDAVAIHPYSTPAEQFTRQMAVLRWHPSLKDMPFEVTEFGTDSVKSAGNHLVKNYCQFALAGVTKAMWFPANLRGRRTVPLFTPNGRLTSAGLAYRTVAKHMEGKVVTDISEDQFTYGCKFGNDTYVIWGAARAFKLGDAAQVFDLSGKPVTSPPETLDPETPIIVISDSDTPFTLGELPLIADSYYQFSYPEKNAHKAEGDGFERFAKEGKKTIPLLTMPGQDRPNVPWVPWRGHPDHKGVRLTAETLLPSTSKDIVHVYTAEHPKDVTLTAHFKPGKKSEDGVIVRLSQNGKPLLEERASHENPVEIQRKPISMSSGDTLEIVVAAGESQRGDLTRYRITLERATTQTQ